jgi:hypothetical protein
MPTYHRFVFVTYPGKQQVWFEISHEDINNRINIFSGEIRNPTISNKRRMRVSKKKSAC